MSSSQETCSAVPHKHAELIKAWADNPKIKLQCRPPSAGKDFHDWEDLLEDEFPVWKEYLEYRIKPEPKSDIHKYVNIYNSGDAFIHTLLIKAKQGVLTSTGEPHESLAGTIDCVIDGETGKLKSVEILL